MKLKFHENRPVNSLVFWLYIYFLIDFFLRLSERIPGYGMIRPTLLLVVVLIILLVSQKDKFIGMGDDPIFKKIKWLILYVLITVPIVTWPGSVLNNIPDFVKAAVFFFFTVLIIDTEKRLKTFLFVFIASQMIRVFEPLYLNVTDGYWGSRTHLGHGEFASRLAGAPADIVNPNGLGFVIVTIVPYLYYLAWKSSSRILQLVSLVSAPLLMYALVLTMSRGAFLALLVVLWMIFKEAKHKLFMIILICAGFVSIWVNLSDNHKDRYLSLVSSDTMQSSSAEGRMSGMVTEFGVALKRPIFGHGLGTSAEAKTHAGVGWKISHNLYAEILIEIGVIGFIIFFLFLKSIYYRFKDNMERMQLNAEGTEVDFASRLNTALITVFWMYVVYSINYFGLSTYYWYLFGGLAIAFSRIYFSKETKFHNNAAVG